MTFGRWVVGLLLLMALGVLVKLILQLTGLYELPESISGPRAPVRQVQKQPIPPAPAPAPEAQPMAPAAPPSQPAPASAPASEPESKPVSEPEQAVGRQPESESKSDEPTQPADERAASDGTAGPEASGGAGSGVAPERYLVQPGDTLWHIARRSCGGGVRYRTIHAHNLTHIRNPHRIWPGQVVEIPDTCR